MCGICGWVDWHGRAEPGPVRAMSEALIHRGPDGEGTWLDPAGIAALGHRRLAVLDLSDRAVQPMVGSSGAVLVYNGEIYNFRRLRSRLEASGLRCASTGDTEVVLRALETWGPAAVESFEGQFALALWDVRRRRLLLARDRLGIKPLFWAEVDQGFVFASELPALLEHPHVVRRVDHDQLSGWLQLGYSAGHSTLVKGVRKLEPGHILEVTAEGVEKRRWYDPLGALSTTGPRPAGIGEAAEELEGLVRHAVRDRLVSDVPLGAFLSGGVDSGVIVGAAAAEGAHPDTLTVVFPDGEDESPVASRVARGFGLDHVTTECRASNLDRALADWGRRTGDPLADPSFLPTGLVSAEARRRWTVALSGDGGDELLSGYPRLRAMPRLERVLRVPRPLRRLPAVGLPSRRWGAKLRAALECRDAVTAYQALQGVWPAAEAARLLGRGEPEPAWDARLVERTESLDPWTRWRAVDLLTFLPERMLTKVDRASMSSSLEVRVPLLDHRVVEFLLGVDSALTRGKDVLRAVGARLGVPPSPRRKTGFEVPLGAWVRGPLREGVHSLLSGATAAGLGLDRRYLEEVWRRHQSGGADFAERLFAVAVLVSWVDDVIEGNRERGSGRGPRP